LDQVLMIGDGDKQQVGKPRIVGAAVAATIVAQKKGEKVLIFKKRRRQNYRRKRGHRQELTVLKVTDIRAAG
ncbi:MAG: 50S ribosomal protein L21, partial [Alphaproteobacteria bacterium]|nr:50S ribosomal protein L21 [Alphaproteobacteria bacterium]